MRLSLIFKLAVPVVFFGYALVANLVLLATPEARLTGAGDVLKGGLTAELDAIYRDHLPHKDPAVGIIGAVRYALLREGRAGVAVGQDGMLFTSEELRPVDPAVYARARAEVTRASSDLADMGVGLVVVPIPAKLDLLRDHTRAGDAAAAQEALYHQFLADMAQAGVAVVDSRADLAALPAPFLQRDTHWTPAGAARVARAVADSGLVPPGSDTIARHNGAPALVPGDLVSFVTSDALAPLVGLGPVTVTPYTATVAAAPEAGGLILDLFGSEGGGVDLVGTSYSANPNWSFDEALKLALGRDVVNHAEEGQGPFAPMRAYLDRLDPLAPPEAVIWEIPVRYLADPALLPPPEGT